MHTGPKKNKKTRPPSSTFYPPSTWLLPSSPRPSPLHSGLDTYHASDRIDRMRAMRGAQREHSGVPRIAPSRVHGSARDKEQLATEAIERIPGNHVNPPLPISSCRTLPRVRDSNTPGSWEGCGLGENHPMYAHSTMVVRKSPPRSSRRTRRADGEHHPLTAQRSASSSITPSTWPISGEEGSRAFR